MLTSASIETGVVTGQRAISPETETRYPVGAVSTVKADGTRVIKTFELAQMEYVFIYSACATGIASDCNWMLLCFTFCRRAVKSVN